MDELEKKTAEAVGQVIVDTANDLRTSVARIFGAAALEFGAMLHDQVKHWRFKNLNRILQDVDEINNRKGLKEESTQSLPLGDAIRVIEASSYEEEESIQKLWAALISNATSPSSKTSVKKAYIDILHSLAPSEAALLKLLWEGEQKAQFKTPAELKSFNEHMNEMAATSWRKFPKDVRDTAIQNLMRMRCLTFRPRTLNIGGMFTQLPTDRPMSFDRWSAIDSNKFEEMLKQMMDMIFVASGVRDYKHNGPVPLHGASFWSQMQIEVPEMNFMLTPLSNDLMKACSVAEFSQQS